MAPKAKPPHLAKLAAPKQPPWAELADAIERKQIAALMRRAKERWQAEREREAAEEAEYRAYLMALEGRRGDLAIIRERKRVTKLARDERQRREAEIQAVLQREANWRELSRARRSPWQPSGCEPLPTEAPDSGGRCSPGNMRDSERITVRRLDRFDYDGIDRDATGELRALLARALVRGQ
jgi:hypothetical protein